MWVQTPPFYLNLTPLAFLLHNSIMMRWLKGRIMPFSPGFYSISNAKHWSADTKVGYGNFPDKAQFHSQLQITWVYNFKCIMGVPVQCQQHLIPCASGWMLVSVWALPEKEHDRLTLRALLLAPDDTAPSIVVSWQPLLWGELQSVSADSPALPPWAAEAGQPRSIHIFLFGSSF